METNNLDLITAHPFFKGLPLATLKQLSSQITLKTLPPRTTLIEEGDDTDSVFFIHSGLIKVFRLTPDGEEVGLVLRSKGDIVGDMAAIESLPRSATVQTLTTSLVFSLSANTFRSLLQNHPSTYLYLLRLLASRLRHLSSQFEDVASANLKDRVWSTLSEIAPLFKDWQITITQDELAHLVAATRPRVAQELQELAKEKIISLDYKQITLLRLFPKEQT